jgi:multidrug efflux pump subunit AcrA (membrane-fusion protein)
VQEPYIKAWQAKAASRAGDTTQQASMRKQALNMNKDFAALLTAHDRQEAAAADLRQKLRVLRAEREQQERALELARRTVDRLAADNGQLESQAAGGCWPFGNDACQAESYYFWQLGLFHHSAHDRVCCAAATLSVKCSVPYRMPYRMYLQTHEPMCASWSHACCP